MSEFEDFKNDLIKAIENGDIYHGVATLKQDLTFSNGTIVPKNTSGLITAWLPDEAHAVLFDENKYPGCWAIFDNQKWFENFFDYKLK